MDFARARRMMVDGQVRTSDVTDLALLAAFETVPRERFVPVDKTGLAYLDLDVPVQDDQNGRPTRRMLRPMVVAKLMQAAEVARTDRVLEVGCGTGYAAALLSHLAQEVVALEQDTDLAKAATAALAAVGAANVSVVTGPLTAGWEAKAPYDVILLSGATEIVPRALFPQLKDGGRLICVQGRKPGGKAFLYRSVGGDVSGRAVFDSGAPLLPGFVEPPAFVF
jgi:protein-L-isoaspartate(D-aspartate) O-methyltransferase